MLTKPPIRCDSCSAEWWGATKRDVLAAGWKVHDAGGATEFLMCGDCEGRYALLWAARAGVPDYVQV